MGEIHENITARKLCEMTATKEDTLRMRFAKLHESNPALFPDKWRIDGELTPKQVAALIQAGERKGSAPKEKDSTTDTISLEQGRPNVVAPQKVESNWRATLFVWVAFLIVMGHAGFIWYDMHRLWATPGKIGGGAIFLFIFGGMVLMSDKTERMKEIRENMLWAVTLLESLAIVVHQATFYRSAGEAFVAGLGLGYTWALAAVVCLISIGSTIFYQKVIQ